MQTPHDSGRKIQFAIACVGYVLLAGVLLLISRSFGYTSLKPMRPILTFVSVMFLMFVVHVFLLRSGLQLAKTTTRKNWITIIWSVAIASRLIVLASHPIQEVDYYRYLWDGKVSSVGVSPFAFAPQEIIDAFPAQAFGADNQDDLRNLVALAKSSAANETILRRIHYAELPTVYPPVSQSVFRCVGHLVPRTASVATNVISMKLAIMLFDLGVIAGVFWLLRIVNKHPAWAMAYAWNPLVLKEFANSSHLDSIVVFFAVIAIAIAAQALKSGSTKQWSFAAATLALATGAKIYPIVLCPLLVVACYRKSGLGACVASVISFSVVIVLCFLPLAFVKDPGPQQVPSPQVEFSILDELEPPSLDMSPVGGVSNSHEQPDVKPSDGISAFVFRWEMNDLMFAILIENLRSDNATPWFRWTNAEFRDSMNSWVMRFVETTPSGAAFILARGVTLFAFVVVAIWIAFRTSPAPRDLCRSVFLTLACFWFLSPTLNPWYWIWVLPFIPFVRSTSWWLVGGMLTLYYTRFWFMYHETHPLVERMPYQGATNFDYIVVFFEHVPWILAILISCGYRRVRLKSKKRA